MKSIRLKIIAIIAVVIVAVGCSVFFIQKAYNKNNASNDIPQNPQSVVALSSSLTEIWLLAGGTVVGTTSDTLDRNFPEITEDVTVVGSVKDPNIEEILALEPDYVILNDALTGHLALEEPLKNAGVPYYFTHIETFDDYLASLQVFCDLTGNMEKYQQNGTDVQVQIDNAINSYTLPSDVPNYLVMRVHSSGYDIMTEDNVVCNILDTLGLKNIAQNDENALDDLSLENILETDPDYIFITTMGNPQDATQNLEQMFTLQPAWQQLTAVKENHVNILEKELFHYKPNAKWGQAYEEIIRLLQA